MIDIFKKLKKRKEEAKKNRISFARKYFTIKKKNTGEFNNFIDNFNHSSLIMLIIGRRGSGKTALGMSFVELGKILGKKLHVIGFENSNLPKWIKKDLSLDEIPNNSLVLVDESGIMFSSRSSMKKSNKDMSNLLSIARHKNLTLIFVTQNSAMLDLNVLRLADVLLFKEPSLLQNKFERKGIKEMFDKVGKEFKKLDSKKEYYYIISDDFEGLVHANLPKFWNESVSKSFSRK